MSELKRCPICDKEVEITKDNLMGFHVIECNICKILMYSRNKEELINKWNTQKPMQNIVERLEELAHDNPMVTDNYILRMEAIGIVKEEADLNE